MRGVYCILGPPGSGKGTLSQSLSQKHGFVNLKATKLCRELASRDSDLGIRMRDSIDTPSFVPDELIVRVVKKHLEEIDGKTRGCLLDGFPWTVGQAQLLVEVVSLSGVILLKAPDELLVARVADRRIDPATGATFNLKSVPPPSWGGETLQARRRDEPESFRKRLEDFHAHIGQVLQCFDVARLEVDASVEPQTVFDDVVKQLPELELPGGSLVQAWPRSSWVILRRRSHWGKHDSDTYAGDLLPASTYRIEMRDTCNYVMNRRACGKDPLNDGTALVHSVVVSKGARPEMVLVFDDALFPDHADPQQINLGDAQGAYAAVYPCAPPDIQPILLHGAYLLRRFLEANVFRISAGKATNAGLITTRLTVQIFVSGRSAGGEQRGKDQCCSVRQILEETYSGGRSLWSGLESYASRTVNQQLKVQFYLPSPKDVSCTGFDFGPDRYDIFDDAEKETLVTLHGDFSLPRCATCRFICGRALDLDFKVSDFLAQD